MGNQSVNIICPDFKNCKQKIKLKMSTTISHPTLVSHESTRSLRSLFNRFLDWSADQQENRLGWQGLSLLGFTCFFTPLTILMISLSGANLFLIMIALVAMEVNLVVNLIVMPTKITIPAFFLAAVADITIIAISAFAVI
jgi:ABC-type multidrug transport system permease subunit